MKSDRYILTLRNQHKKNIQNLEKGFDIQIVSSEELSSKNRFHEVINKDQAVLFKNLNVLIVDKIDEKLLTKAKDDKRSPVVSYEKERTFLPVGEIELIRELKLQSLELVKKIKKLEKLIENKSTISNAPTKMEWGLEAINLKQTDYTGKNVDVCILDTGFDISHSDFKNRNIQGKSFIENEPWDIDINGHGTHCAGIAAGGFRSDTGKRYGIAREANIKIGKVLSNRGKGTTSSIIDAIDWAITKKYRVISLSLASPADINEIPSPLFEMVGQKTLENNCIIIAAAGNDSYRPALPKPVSIPANSSSIFAVAAIDNQLEIANFSNAGIDPTTGGEINVCAPGVNIISSYSKKNENDKFYRVMSGTSMAAPHVSGLAATYVEQFPQKPIREIWNMLQDNAKKIKELQVRDAGHGLIQAI